MCFAGSKQLSVARLVKQSHSCWESCVLCGAPCSQSQPRGQHELVDCKMCDADPTPTNHAARNFRRCTAQPSARRSTGLRVATKSSAKLGLSRQALKEVQSLEPSQSQVASYRRKALCGCVEPSSEHCVSFWSHGWCLDRRRVLHLLRFGPAGPSSWWVRMPRIC
jgi:hypothetical protein